MQQSRSVQALLPETEGGREIEIERETEREAGDSDVAPTMVRGVRLTGGKLRLHCDTGAALRAQGCAAEAAEISVLREKL